MGNGIKNMINKFVKSVIISSPKVTQICTGNGNIQCRGDVTAGKVVINGRTISLEDGNRIEDEWIKGGVKIEITGDVHTVDIPAGDITINGNVTGGVKTSQGDIEIGGDVEGDVKTSMGNITIGGKHSGGGIKASMGNVNING